jgi:hypothetical protein
MLRQLNMIGRPAGRPFLFQVVGHARSQFLPSCRADFALLKCLLDSLKHKENCAMSDDLARYEAVFPGRPQTSDGKSTFVAQGFETFYTLLHARIEAHVDG